MASHNLLCGDLGSDNRMAITHVCPGQWINKAVQILPRRIDDLGGDTGRRTHTNSSHQTNRPTGHCQHVKQRDYIFAYVHFYWIGKPTS